MNLTPLLAAAALGIQAGSALPDGFGLSAKYPGDRGIASDAQVLFAEDFETGSLEETIRRWSEASNKDGKVLALTSGGPAEGGGKRCVQMTATLGENTGGHLYKRLPKGVDKVFARFYVKFAQDADYIHHFVHLGGYNPPTSYPQGGAGERPRGDERVTVGIEPHGDYGRNPPPGAWTFYTYWHEMKISADNHYWGNGIRNESPSPVPKDRWQCVEVMLKLNSAPEKPDGELALWLDGKLISHIHQGVRRSPWSGMGFHVLKEGGEPFEGFRWRTSDDLKINFFWLLHYVTENPSRQNQVAKPNPINRVWFDNIVVSTEYVGPIKAAAPLPPARVSLLSAEPNSRRGKVGMGVPGCSVVPDAENPYPIPFPQPVTAPTSLGNRGQEKKATSGGTTTGKVRVGAVQAKRRSVDYRLGATEALAAVDNNLDELERIVHKAGVAGCDALALPEDTLGLLDWRGMNEAAAPQVLREAVLRMLTRLGRAAASHHMYLIVCSDYVERDGGTYNSAFLLGRDGKEIGRYHKVCPTWSEAGSIKRGSSFPVFETPDLGTVGMLICYDMVFPETARCLALQNADIIFFPTMGGGSMGEEDLGLQSLRVRAAENFVWIVVAFRGSGAMIISPQGKIVAKAEGADGLVYADIDPRNGKEGGDSSNTQRDMRARLFRERNPAAFGFLTDPRPPVISRAPIDLSSGEAGRIMARMLTVGEEDFKKADALERSGKVDAAVAAYRRLSKDYRGSWIDRVSRERVEALVGNRKTPAP